MQLMCDNIVIGNVNEVEGKVIMVEGIPIKLQPFDFAGQSEVDIEVLKDWLSERVPPKTRGNIKEILKIYGLKRYNSYELAKNTRASLVGDRWWVRVNNEDTFERNTLLGISGEKAITLEEYLTGKHIPV